MRRDVDSINERDEYVATSGFWLKVAAGMFSIMLGVFATWAWVVWEGVQVVEDTMTEFGAQMRVTRTELQLLEQRLDEVRQAKREHVRAPWHINAGIELGRLRQQIEDMRTQYNRSMHQQPQNAQATLDEP